ncbi:MAG: hypothetical protein B6I23_01550 [Rickettsiaceae bacterium 4572_127]|nr:MAG: hypothetical protein B6I23_01550 [Rickettsiaceae bacterium 4572_127]
MISKKTKTRKQEKKIRFGEKNAFAEMTDLLIRFGEIRNNSLFDRLGLSPTPCGRVKISLDILGRGKNI